MFIGFPDKIHEEKPSFLDFENNDYGQKIMFTDGPTDGQTVMRTDGRTYGPTDLLIEMRGRI